jgi:hypothetical protein
MLAGVDVGEDEMIRVASIYGVNHNMLRDALWGDGMYKLIYCIQADYPKGKMGLQAVARF